MKEKGNKVKTVMGHTLPPARLTFGALRIGFLYILAPFLLVMLGLDLLLYSLFEYGFDSCYAVLCLFE